MTHAATSPVSRPRTPASPSTRLVVIAALAVWLALVTTLGAHEAFVAPPGAPPLRLLIAATTPVIIFLAALRFSRAFREIVLAADLRLMMAVQAWRFAGFGFLALSVQGVLPGLFAWPAGLGDMAIGLSAPWMLAALIRDPHVAASKSFVAWNLFGILDLVVAVGTGALGTLLAGTVASTVSMAPMARMPLVLVPTFLVPLFVMLHVTALVQSRRMPNAALARR